MVFGLQKPLFPVSRLPVRTHGHHFLSLELQRTGFHDLFSWSVFEEKKSATATDEVRKARLPFSQAAGQKKATGQDRPIKENKSTQPREKK